MKSLCARLAYHVNRLLFRRGRLIVGRFFSRDLETPRDVRNALAYVLGNFRKHVPEKYRANCSLDVYSSAPYFRGFCGMNGASPLDRVANLIPRVLAPPLEPPVQAPGTWLLSVGWQQAGSLSMQDGPKNARTP
ncbi:MAG: hypothetical protein ACOY0T_30070 [Myxococcota bacterium]